MKGRVLVIGMVVVAIVLAVCGWWYRLSSSGQAADFWGPAGARLIIAPEQILAWRRGGEDQAQRQDITRAPGIINFRHALGEDRSYGFAATPPPEIQWEYGFWFAGTNDQRLLVFISDDFLWLQQRDGPASLHTTPAWETSGKIAGVEPLHVALGSFLNDVFGDR